MQSHYTTLGVGLQATQDEIKQAYRKLAGQYHPDRGGDVEKFKNIQVAYDVLGDVKRRAEYDSRATSRAQFNTDGLDASAMEDMLSKFNFGSLRRKNKDIQTRVAVQLENLLDNQNILVSIKTTNGDRQTVTVEIPRGTNEGSVIKYPNLGDNFFATLPRGDLYVHLQLDPHPIFQVDGANLITQVDIDAIGAIIGTTVLVKTLDNKEYELTIPPGTQGDTKFKIANQGLYQKDKITRGHLYIVAKIKIPTNLTPSQIETLKNL